jgi:hypothetical protein
MLMSQLAPNQKRNLLRSLKAFLRLRSKERPRTTHCTDCGSVCMNLPAQFWLYGEEEQFSIPLPFCPQCHPEFLSQLAAAA